MRDTLALAGAPRASADQDLLTKANATECRVHARGFRVGDSACCMVLQTSALGLAVRLRPLSVALMTPGRLRSATQIKVATHLQVVNRTERSWRLHGRAPRRRVLGQVGSARRARTSSASSTRLLAPGRTPGVIDSAHASPGHVLAQPDAVAVAHLPLLLQVLRVRDAPGAPVRARGGARDPRRGGAPAGQGAAGADGREARRSTPRSPRGCASTATRTSRRTSCGRASGRSSGACCRTRTSACSRARTWRGCAR